MIAKNEILETINMISMQNLDVRTITLAVSLFDCISDDGEKTCRKIYDKLTRFAGKLVAIGNEIGLEFGIPIVNKRISVTPISVIGASSGAYVEIARTLDKVALETGVDFIGGYSALLQKGITNAEQRFL